MDEKSTASKKVLIVEDDNFLADLLLDHLKKNNINAFLCRDAETALAEIQKEAPALLLTDLHLPGMDGYSLLRKLKELNILSKIAVIVLSNLTQAEKVQEGIDLGAKDFLGKSSFDLDDITKRVTEVLAGIK